MGKRRSEKLKTYRLRYCMYDGKRNRTKAEAIEAAARARNRSGDKNIVHYLCPKQRRVYHIGHQTLGRERALAYTGNATVPCQSERSAVPQPAEERETTVERVGVVAQGLRTADTEAEANL